MTKKKNNHSFQAITELALKVRSKYAQLEKKKYGRAWTKEEIAQGFVIDVGDLMEEVMKQSGIRGEKSRDKLVHELCDCLWSILILADKYKVDLDKEFPHSMEKLSEKINKELK